VPDTTREILQKQIADTIAASHQLRDASLINSDTHIDQSREGFARRRGQPGGTRLG